MEPFFSNLEPDETISSDKKQETKKKNILNKGCKGAFTPASFSSVELHFLKRKQNGKKNATATEVEVP